MLLNIFDQYAEIFSDPFFLILTTVILSISFIIYQFVVRDNVGVDEEEEYLIAQLNYYGLTYVNSTVTTATGPFPQTVWQVTSLLDKKQAATIYNYRQVKVQNAAGEELDLWARVSYRKGKLTNVTWNPVIE